MSLDIKIVKYYSNALFKGAKLEKKEKKVLEQISALGAVLQSSKKVQEVFCSPVVDSQVKLKIADLLVKKFKFDAITFRFLEVLITNARFYLLGQIADDYKEIVANSEGIKYASVVSAYKMGKKEIALISSFLEDELNKKIDLEVDVDPSLVGGMIIKYDCNLIDCSVQGALDRIK